MTIGATNLPRYKPNLNQIAFKGVNKIEFIKPKYKKIKLVIKDQTLMSSLLRIG